jgi:hypothetical protein
MGTVQGACQDCLGLERICSQTIHTSFDFLGCQWQPAKADSEVCGIVGGADGDHLRSLSRWPQSTGDLLKDSWSSLSLGLDSMDEISRALEMAGWAEVQKVWVASGERVLWGGLSLTSLGREHLLLTMIPICVGSQTPVGVEDTLAVSNLTPMSLGGLIAARNHE